MRTDFQSLEDGDIITLIPRSDNPIHRQPIKAHYQQGYFYCDGSPVAQGPDYYLGDVLKFNEGFIIP